MIPEIEKLEGFELIQDIDNLVLSAKDIKVIENAYHELVYGDYPLLEYVQFIANEICPRYYYPFRDIETGEGIIGVTKTHSACADLFAKRLLEGKIELSFYSNLTKTERLFQDVYEEKVEVLATLEGFGIDKDKFWYLILFLKDFIEGLTSGGVIEKSPIEDLQNIVTLLQNKDAKKLSIKIGKFEFNNPKTFEALSLCINEQIEKLKENQEYRSSKALMAEDHSRRNVGIKQYFFTKYMEWFLSHFEANEEISFAIIDGNKIPIETYDKRILISRIIHIINFTKKQEDISFYEIQRRQNGEIIDKLKGCLREYDKNPPKLRNMNMRYLNETPI